MECIFCKIVAGEIPCHKVWEDEDHLAFLDINPIREGHTLVIPKTHSPDLFEMDSVSYLALQGAAREVAKRLKDVFSTPRVGVIVMGFDVDHAHIHLVPINGGKELDLKNAKPGDPAELAKLAQRIRA